MIDVFVDSLIGPSYHCGGLAPGNPHSMANKNHSVSPKQAALKGLEKMKYNLDQGQVQYVFPPENRNYIKLMAEFGCGPEEFLLRHRRKFSAILSSSSAWMANAWTATAANDSADQTLHITPANLSHSYHRSLETSYTQKMLKKLFKNKNKITIHDPVRNEFSDEGAANLIRLSYQQSPGLYVFVHGKTCNNGLKSFKYPVRQHLQAHKTISAVHKLDPKNVIYLQQHYKAINAGVFHNDVIAFGLHNVLVVHEYAYIDQSFQLNDIMAKYEKITGKKLHVIEFTQDEFPIEDAVESYLFNSQLYQLSPNTYKLLCPSRCKNNTHAKIALKRIRQEFPGQLECDFIDVEESLKNGGGPACLRAVLTMSEQDETQLNPDYKLTPARYATLKKIITTLYPDEFSLEQAANKAYLQSLMAINKRLQ